MELTPELLARWGYDPEKVLAAAPAERAALQAQLTRLEAGRLRRLELLRAARPQGWRAFVDERELLTPEGERIVVAWLKERAGKPMLVPAAVKDFARADGKPLTEDDLARARAILDRMFEGLAAKGGAGVDGDVVVDARVRNGTVYDVTVTDPRTGVALSVGQLFVDGRHPVAEASPYANLTWGKDSRPESAVDYRFKASLGYVDLRSRFFSSAPDSGPSALLDLGRKLGVPEDSLSKISRYTTYDDPYQTHGIIVSSLLAQLGRAYHLAGPVDWSWTAGSLIKTMWVAPNAAFDETLGLRVRLPDGMSVGFFGGVQQNLSPVGNQLLQEALSGGSPKGGLYVENDPHASVALWGRVPGASDLSFSVTGTQRWTATTQVREGELSLMTTFLRHPMTVKGGWSRESGPGIGFDRQKARAEVDYHISEDAEAYLAYERDRVRYGNAEVDSNAFLAGFRMAFGGNGSKLSIEQLMGGRYDERSPLRGEFSETLTRLQRDLAAGVTTADALDSAYRRLRPGMTPAELDSTLNQLSLALSRLDTRQAQALFDQLPLNPAQRAALGDLWLKTVSPTSPYYAELARMISSDRALGRVDDWASYFEAHRADLLKAIGLLTDRKTWDGALVSAARAQMISAMRRIGPVNLPILGQNFALKIDAPAVLATANILQSRGSPLAPVQPAQVDAWLRREAGRSLGLDGNPTDDQLASAVFGLADRQIRDQLTRGLAPLSTDLAGLNTPEALASRVLASVPPGVATLLRQNYGNNLTGLIPADLNGPAVKDFLAHLPDRVTDLLERRYGAQLASGIAQAMSWAGDLLARELNMTMIQLLLASEELDRLTVDHGAKAADLDLRMAMRSFEQLDERGRDRSRDALRGVTAAVVRASAEDEARLAAKFEAHGRAVLQTLQLSPTWPAGLRVEVTPEAWMPLLTLYGDGRVFALVQEMREKYAAGSHPDGLTVTLGWRGEDPMMGTWVTPSKSPPRLKIELTRPKDERDAAFRLSHLADYVDKP